MCGANPSCWGLVIVFIQHILCSTCHAATFLCASYVVQHQVVESGGKNIEIAVMTKVGLKLLEEAEVEEVVKEIEAEKAAAEEAKKKSKRTSS